MDMSTERRDSVVRRVAAPPTNERGRALDLEIGRRLEEGRLAVPVLPAVANTVLAMLEDPDADAASIAAAICHDQTLAGHVMKYANSPLLRVGAPVVSLQQGISRLGIRRVAEVALAACLGPKLFKAPRYARVIEALWRESLGTALWAREIARALRRNVEVSFLCGLLHRIGRPVVLQSVHDILGRTDDASTPDEADLLVLLERHGVAAGLAVAAHWHLPEPVLLVIAHIGDFRAASASRELVAMIAVAHDFALQTLFDGPPDVATLREDAAMTEINLYRSDAARLLEQTDAMRATLAAIAP
jgi:HD-like signal output (HDOD) protein